MSGDLAPFDEVSVAFRGPLNLYNIAWYEGTADETLERTTTWTRRYGRRLHNKQYVDVDGRSMHELRRCPQLARTLPSLEGLIGFHVERRRAGHTSEFTYRACRMSTNPDTPNAARPKTPSTNGVTARPEKTLPS